MIWEWKTKVQVDFAASITMPDQIDPRFNKQGDDENWTEICQHWSQVDQMTPIKEEGQDQKTIPVVLEKSYLDIVQKVTILH